MAGTRTRVGRRSLLRPTPLTIVLALAPILLVVTLLLSGDRVPISRETAPVSVSGEALPPPVDGGDDPAVGRRVPDIRGQDLHGAPLRLVTPGDPTAVLVLAHWCSHCQAEVPDVVEWLEQHGPPAGVRLVAVSTLPNPDAPNYPASAWFEREGWSLPTLVDDEAGAAAAALGLAGTPYWVFVDRDGDVVGRVTGRIGAARLEAALTALAGAA